MRAFIELPSGDVAIAVLHANSREGAGLIRRVHDLSVSTHAREHRLTAAGEEILSIAE